MTSDARSSNMIAWTDIESEGLNERGMHLLEVAVVFTNGQLQEMASMEVVIKPDNISVDAMVERMDPYVREMHTKNGLIDDIRTRGVEPLVAQALLVNFAKETTQHEPPMPSGRCLKCKLGRQSHLDPNRPALNIEEPLICQDGTPFQEGTDPALKHIPLAGSTIAFDRRWQKQHVPEFEKLFSYRSIDVSALTELARRWAPVTYELRPRSGDVHRALVDVRGSIEMLRYYSRVTHFITDPDDSAWDLSFDSTVKRLREAGFQVHR